MEPLRQRIEAVLASCGQEHFAAAARQFFGKGHADPGTRPGDQRPFTRPFLEDGGGHKLIRRQRSKTSDLEETAYQVLSLLQGALPQARDDGTALICPGGERHP